MIITASWMSAGVLSFLASVGTAAETPTLTPIPTGNSAGAPTALTTVDCNPCADACDPCCPKPPRKWKQACTAPAKIIVHQAEPIVEFRNNAPTPSNVASSGGRPVINDRCVRPVGGEGHGCGCNQNGAGGSGFLKTKTKNYFYGGGWGCGGTPQVTMAAMPVTVQAYVPQVVQTYSVMPAAMTYGFAGPSAFVAPPNNDAAVRALADLIAGAAVANAPRSANAAMAPVPQDNRLPALEARVQQIDERLSSLERKIDALCKTR